MNPKTRKLPVWVRWAGNLTPTTCHACRERIGNYYDLNRLTVRPPLHPNCGCRLVRVTSRAEERAAAAGISALATLAAASASPPRTPTDSEMRRMVIEGALEQLRSDLRPPTAPATAPPPATTEPPQSAYSEPPSIPGGVYARPPGDTRPEPSETPRPATPPAPASPPRIPTDSEMRRMVIEGALAELRSILRQSAPPATAPPLTVTAPPQARNEPDTATIPGGVYERNDDLRIPFTGGTPFLTRLLVDFMINISNNLLIFFEPFSSDSNYENNINLPFDGTHIRFQSIGLAPEVRMGFAPIDDNACGWIAAYNTFVTLGMDVHPAEIVRFFENNNGLNAYGALGTNPLVFDKLFREYGLESTTTLFENALHIIPYVEVLPIQLMGLPTTTNVNIDALARSGRTVILTYYNNVDDIEAGAHYVAAVWDAETKEYTIWNVSGTDPESIYDFLGTQRGLISMTVIH